MTRRPVPVLLGSVLALAVVAVPASAGPAASTVGRGSPTTAAVKYAPPLTGPLRVLTPFDPPATPYGPGHLGVDLAAAVGTPVHSAGPGRVTFAGPVASRDVVVVAHPDGISTEYEPVRAAVHAGTAVATGTLLGHVDGRHPSCAPATCLHWGARRATTYLNPLDLLRPLGPVRLLPWTGGSG